MLYNILYKDYIVITLNQNENMTLSWFIAELILFIYVSGWDFRLFPWSCHIYETLSTDKQKIQWSFI